MSDRLTAPTFAREIGDAGRSSQAAFGVGAVIGALGGLIGLGGAEFRLPLLIGTFRFGALQAVILNKAMSLSVVASALPFRAATVPCAAGPLADHRQPAHRQPARRVVRRRVGNPARLADALPRHRCAAARDRGRPRAWT